jgi:large subunit ribosomal protein L25
VVRREIELVCPADAIPEQIELDLAKADIGDSLHISQVTLPAGVHPAIADRDFTIATIAAPTVVAEEAAEEQEAAHDAAEAAEEEPEAAPREEAG